MKKKRLINGLVHSDSRSKRKHIEHDYKSVCLLLLRESLYYNAFLMEQRDYFEEVYEVVRLVPKGRVTTYGSIARYLSLRAGARMVGWAMNGCHNRPDVPAHRVVNSVGVLSGKHFFGGPTIMEQLLEDEGVRVKNDKVVDFKTVYWDPTVELAL